MEQDRTQLEKEYRAKSEKLDQVDRRMRIVNYGILSLFIAGGLLWKLSKIIIVAAVLIGAIWFWYSVLVYRRMNAEIKRIKVLLFGNEEKTIKNAAFQDLLEEYAFNQLEPLYGNDFFRRWKLTQSNDDCQNIDLVFTKRGHEISMDISDDGISILFDEECADICVEFGWEDDSLKDAYDVYKRITEECQRMYAEILRLEKAKHT